MELVHVQHQVGGCIWPVETRVTRDQVVDTVTGDQVDTGPRVLVPSSGDIEQSRTSCVQCTLGKVQGGAVTLA